MSNVTIRRALEDEHAKIAQVWLESWATVDLKPVSEQALADARPHPKRTGERLEPLCRRRYRPHRSDARLS